MKLKIFEKNYFFFLNNQVYSIIKNQYQTVFKEITPLCWFMLN